jgi:hypothetical protein
METYPVPNYVYKAWRSQRHSAKRRGIPFKFGLFEWHCWWNRELIALGSDARRGNRRGQYMMARFGDAGAYEHGNVYAATPAQNSNDIPGDVREAMTRRATETRKERGKPRGYHLKVRGDGHPKSKPVVTPLGRFGSIALAAEAHGITRQAGFYHVRAGTWTPA